MNKERGINLDFRQLLKKDHETIFTDLKEQAINAAIDERAEFEKNLLQLAQEINDDEKRNAIYEVLVSLQTIRKKYRPEKGLQAKFQTAFDGGNYQEAEDIYKRLAKQGLDYIESYQIERGKLIPLFAQEKDILLLYNERELIFYDLQFEQLAKVQIPGALILIDLIASPTCIYPDGKPEDDLEAGKQQIWLLLVDKEGKKLVLSTHIEDFQTTKDEIDSYEQRAIYLEQKLSNAHSLSYFKNRLLVITEKSIHYYQEKGTWKEWYTTGKRKTEITAFAFIKDGFWIGFSNGDVIILKKLKYEGVRAVFKGFPESIKSIRAAGKHVIIKGSYILGTSDHTGKSATDFIHSKCRISQVDIIDNDLLIMLLVNGMLTAREIEQGNIRWQINLGDKYELLFSLGEKIYCGRNDGEVVLFDKPAFHSMVKELKGEGIFVEKHSQELNPIAPIKYIAEFIGRKEILDEIKEKSTAHFLLYGEPRIGKTSLLNVLRDILVEKANCCVLDMEQLLKKAESYDTFESDLIDTCLKQHYLKSSNLPVKSGYQAFRAMVNMIRRDKNFCVIAMDNFFLPLPFVDEDLEKFKFILRSLLLIQEVRVVISCPSLRLDIVKNYFDDFKDILRQRKLFFRKMTHFSEVEVKNTLRKKISLQQDVVDRIYYYIGKFPHLIHLYDQWGLRKKSIEEYTFRVVKTYGNHAFDYFRDLSIDARLLIATCLYEKLIGQKMSYATLYEKFPFIKNCLQKDQLNETLREIEDYGSGLSAVAEKDAFKIDLIDNAQFFFEAAKHISWIKDFKTTYEFTSSPKWENAHKIAQMFTKITGSTLNIDEDLGKKTGKFKDKFYVNKLTEKGLKTLRMPLTTFIVVSLTHWQTDSYKEAFRDLNIEFQEFMRQAGGSQIFYVLLFALHDLSTEKIKNDLARFDRISIIDSMMMKNIILAESPQENASKYIFEQLSIRERSPYTTSGAVPDSLFFGREMEIALIRGLPENIGVFGIRTIGKTSLLIRLYKAFKSQKQWKVFDMDCARLESEEALLKNLAEKMEVPFDEIPDIDKFRQYVTKDAEEKGQRYLFLFDEVDRLVEYDMEHDERIFNTFNRLSNEAMKNGETAARFILFGFHQMWEQMKNPLSRLYNFMVFMPLQALDFEGAMGLVTRPIENIRVNWKNEKDSKYLVDSCSSHPRLLQSACHSLLTILDRKLENRNTIERRDVEAALNSEVFLEICMRFYYAEEKDSGKSRVKLKETKKKRKFWRRVLSRNGNNGDEFLSDIHRITILTAINLLSQNGEKNFTITDIREELKKDDIDVTPNIMRNILDRLCLSGNFRLREESTIIAKEGTKILNEDEKARNKNPDKTIKNLGVKVDKPDVYDEKGNTIPKFTYEFGVKIFPTLLAAHFGGHEKCEEERQKLIKKGDWREYLKRF